MLPWQSPSLVYTRKSEKLQYLTKRFVLFQKRLLRYFDKEFCFYFAYIGKDNYFIVWRFLRIFEKSLLLVEEMRIKVVKR